MKKTGGSMTDKFLAGLDRFLAPLLDLVMPEPVKRPVPVKSDPRSHRPSKPL